MAIIVNNSLPPRMRLADHVIAMRLMDHRTLTKRVLLKRLDREWRALGYNFPRGAVFASMSIVRPRIEFIYDLAAATVRGEVDLDALARGEPDATTRRIFAKHLG